MEEHSYSSQDPKDQRGKLASSPDGRVDNVSAIGFNLDEAMARFGGDRELFVEMAEYFVHDSPAVMDSVRKGIETNDLPAAAKAAHRLKGTVGYFGVAPLVATVVDIEQASKAADRARVESGWPRLVTQVSLLREILTPYCRYEQP
jgi:HPt (histidine-containing phosphotransfer) domain-containing protein